jgi:hypothetical protein
MPEKFDPAPFDPRRKHPGWIAKRPTTFEKDLRTLSLHPIR